MNKTPHSRSQSGGTGAVALFADDQLDLKDILVDLQQGKWIIASVVVFALLVAFSYVFVAERIYSADALLQVEDARSSLGVYSELGDVLPADSGTAAEIEIIRSRTLLANVVEDSELHISAEPDYFPWIGRAFARRSDQPGVSGPMGLFDGYAWGSEAVDIRRLEVEGGAAVSFNIEVRPGNQYEVYADDDQPLARGVVGELVEFQHPRAEQRVVLNVRSIQAAEGKRFEVRHSTLMSAVRALSSRLKISEVGRDTGVIRISLEGEKPDQIKQVVDSVAINYVRQNVERRSKQAQSGLEFLTEQLPEVQADLEAAERRLAQFRQSNKTLDLSAETEAVLERMIDLDRQLAAMELRRAELRRSYTADHPVVQTLNEQEAQLRQEKRKIESESVGLPDVQQDMLRLVREVEVTTGLYTFLLNKVQELRIVKAGTVGNVRIIDAAAVTPFPVKPRRNIAVLVALIMGLLMGAAIVFAARFFRTGIADPDEVERAVEVPVFSVLPLSDDSKKLARRDGHALVCASSPSAVVSEAFRSFRTSLQFTVPREEGSGQVLVISGPAPDVGKTFVATNTAYTLAANGYRVLFVDADMRRGDSHRDLEIRREPGLSTVLSDPSVDGAYQTTRFHENLIALARGKAPPNPAELLSGARFAKLVESWRESYDYIIIDTPPILAVTDASYAGAVADAVFLVGRAGKTQMHELIESRKRLSRGQLSVTGIVVNGLTESLSKHSRGQYGYGYYNYQYASEND